jgi:predicted ribosome quality control (RQC) complex YloA/Tae2 family protein
MVEKKLGNFRKGLTSSGKVMLAGKNAEQNEQVIKQVSEDEVVLHTKAPGSPFVNIKNEDQKISLKDLKEAAVFCAKYSQVWKKSKMKKDVEVHVFKGKDIFKIKGMKLGTFGVKKLKKIIVKKEELLDKKKEEN